MRTRMNEVKLLKKCLQGDSLAFEGIVAKYQGLVCAITYGGIADTQRSEELAHQTFINAWNKLAQLNDLSKFRPWLCSIARNHVKSFIRNKKRDILQKAKPMENANDMPIDEDGPVESAIKKEHIELVDAAIGQIPEEYREVLVLYYRQQYSVRQIAELLDLSEEVAKKRLQRSRKMIKDQLSSIVEETLSATGPKKAFTAAVVASVAGMAIKGAGVATAAGVAASTSTVGGATSLAAVTTGTVAKIVTAAAVIAIGIGSVVTYNKITKPNPQPQLPQAAIVVSKQEDEQDVTVEETTEQSSDGTVNLAAIDEVKDDLDTKEKNSDLGTKVTQKTDKNKSNTAETNSVIVESDNLIVGGFVQSEDGEPIAGVNVQLLWDVKRGDMMMLDVKKAVTDANGRWQCQITGESEDIIVRLKHAGYLSQFFSYRPSFDDLLAQSAVLIMRKGLQVSGFVYDTQGNPVANALVMPPGSITGTNAVYGIQDSAKTTRTDTDGMFLLKAVKSGLQDIAIDASGYAPAFVSVNVVPEMPPIEITLDYGQSLTGVVVDINGEPLSGVEIKIDEWEIIQGQNTNSFSHKNFSILRRQTKTNTAGQYTIEHLPSIGDIEIYFGNRPHFLSSLIQNDMVQNKTKNVTMYPIPTITGTVIDADSGKPITEFEVTAACTWDPNTDGIWGLNKDKITSPQGNFSKTKINFMAHEFPSPGWVAVKINAKGYSSSQSPWMQIGQELPPITIHLKKAQILSSTLFYSDGSPVSKTDVILIEPSSWVEVYNYKIQGYTNCKYRITQTDSNGYFEFSAPSAPTKILVLDYDEYLIADTNNLNDKLTLTSWAYVTGSVETDSDINSNITVQIATKYDPNEQIRWMSRQTTNANGRFEFFYVPAIPQKIRYGSVDSTNTLNKELDVNPRSNQETELRLVYPQ
jgi:RNA polymerase sigma factor (sigma-70 family)